MELNFTVASGTPAEAFPSTVGIAVCRTGFGTALVTRDAVPSHVSVQLDLFIVLGGTAQDIRNG